MVARLILIVRSLDTAPILLPGKKEAPMFVRSAKPMICDMCTRSITFLSPCEPIYRFSGSFVLLFFM